MEKVSTFERRKVVRKSQVTCIAKYVFLLLIFIVLTPNHSFAENQKDKDNSTQTDRTGTQSISINKENFVFDINDAKYQSSEQQQSFIYGDRTYVSLRFAGTILEQWIDWNPTKKVVTVAKPNELQLKQLKANKQQMIASSITSLPSRSSSVNAYMNFATIIVNGKQTLIPDDVTTLLVEGTIFVPIRFLGEILDFNVNFDSKTRSIVMKSKTLPDKTKPETESDESGNSSEDGVTPPIGGQPTVSKESIVAKVESELDDIRDKFIAQGYSLYDAYLASADPQEREQLYNKGLALLSDVETKVNEKLTQLDKELSTNNFDLGTTSNELKAVFEADKSFLLSQLSNNK